MSRPLAIDLFCGLGGWTDGLLAEGYDVIGFDIEQHVYGEYRYPGKLVVQDVLTLHGSQFKDAALIVASPPCQEYSYMAMPWKLAKAKAAAIRADETGKMLADLNRLFDACFRIQKEASIAAHRHIPLIVENVRGAQEWVGRSRWAFGSFHLWGDVPALMPPAIKSKNGVKPTIHRGDGSMLSNIITGDGIKGAHGTSGSHWTNPAERTHIKQPGINLSEVGFNVANAREFGHMVEGASYQRTADDKRQHIGVTRKFASAMIAKIPLPLSRYIAATFKPVELQLAAE